MCFIVFLLLFTIYSNFTLPAGIVRAGTNSNVFLQLYGTDGETSQIALRSPTGSTHKNKFERGNIDKFILEVGELGKLERIILGHDGKGVGSGWYVEELEIYDPEGGIKYKFSLRRWLDVNEGDRQLQVEAYRVVLQKMSRKRPKMAENG